MDVWNYILGYRNTLKSVFETWVVHIPFNYGFLLYRRRCVVKSIRLNSFASPVLI